MTKPQDLASRVDRDIFYIRNATLAFDIRIIVITVAIVLRDRKAF